MGVPEETTPKSSRLKMVIRILAVLLVLSAGGLAARYLYLRFFAQPDPAATVTGNQIREEDTGLDDNPERNNTHSENTSYSGESSVSELSERDKSAGDSWGSERPVADRPDIPMVELCEGQPGGNQRFEVKNMFPGDTETRYFCVRVYHDADLELFFRADITEQTKRLGDAAHIRVTHMETGKVLCDGPFTEVNSKEFSELLQKNAAGESVACYRIDVSLDTSVGNEYQTAGLKADFKWYVRDESGLTSPQTGDTVSRILWGMLAVTAALLMLCLLFGRRQKRGGEQHEQA